MTKLIPGKLYKITKTMTGFSDTDEEDVQLDHLNGCVLLYLYKKSMYDYYAHYVLYNKRVLYIVDWKAQYLEQIS